MLRWLHETWVEFWDLFGSESVRVGEVILSVIKLSWGMALLSPGDTFGTGNAYDGLRILDEDTWGSAFVIFALLQLLGATKRWLWLRMGCVLIASVVWGLITYSFRTGNPNGVGWWYLLALTLINIWLLSRLVWDRIRGRE